MEIYKERAATWMKRLQGEEGTASAPGILQDSLDFVEKIIQYTEGNRGLHRHEQVSGILKIIEESNDTHYPNRRRHLEKFLVDRSTLLDFLRAVLKDTAILLEKEGVTIKGLMGLQDLVMP